MGAYRGTHTACTNIQRFSTNSLEKFEKCYYVLLIISSVAYVFDPTNYNIKFHSRFLFTTDIKNGRNIHEFGFRFFEQVFMNCVYREPIE